MTHKRTSIVAAIEQRLLGLPTCGAHVYVERVRPLTDAELPAILIHEGGEDEPSSYMGNSRPMGRPMRVVLSIMVKATSTAPATTNTALEEIEDALFDTSAHNNLGGLIHSIHLASIEDPDVDDSTDKPVRRLPVILRVAYS